MGTNIPKPALAVLALLVLAGLVFGFSKFAGGSAAPQVEPSSVPDYSKMTPEAISAAHNATPGNSAPTEDGKGRG